MVLVGRHGEKSGTGGNDDCPSLALSSQERFAATPSDIHPFHDINRKVIIPTLFLMQLLFSWVSFEI